MRLESTGESRGFWAFAMIFVQAASGSFMLMSIQRLACCTAYQPDVEGF